MLSLMEAAAATEPPTDRLLRSKQILLLTLHELMFSFNLVSAVGYAFLLCIVKNQYELLWTPRIDWAYYLGRAALRTNDLLVSISAPSVSTRFVARGENAMGWVGLEVTLLISVAAVAVILFGLLRFCAGSAWYRRILSLLVATTTVLAAPACYLVAMVLTRTWASFPEGAESVLGWQSLLLVVFAAEVLVIGIVLVFRKRPFPRWLLVGLVIPHYFFWGWFLWLRVGLWGHTLYTPYALLTLFSISSTVWLLYLRNSQADQSDVSPGRMDVWRMAACGVAAALLLFLWLPGRKHPLASMRDLTSLTIEMSRGACFGSCPAYTIRVHGNGIVEYEGLADVRVKGHQESAITPVQLGQLLEALDNADFSRLEDRAFYWCFDTPSVGISVTRDGRTKGVMSDASCVGTGSGPQARFVRTVDEIDTVVGSERWVKCEQRRCR